MVRARISKPNIRTPFMEPAKEQGSAAGPKYPNLRPLPVTYDCNEPARSAVSSVSLGRDDRSNATARRSPHQPIAACVRPGFDHLRCRTGPHTCRLFMEIVGPWPV